MKTLVVTFILSVVMGGISGAGLGFTFSMLSMDYHVTTWGSSLALSVAAGFLSWLFGSVFNHENERLQQAGE